MLWTMHRMTKNNMNYLDFEKAFNSIYRDSLAHTVTLWNSTLTCLTDQKLLSEPSMCHR